MQNIYKKDKINQVKGIWERKCKTTIIELEELKDKYKETQRYKEKKDREKKYASIKEVFEQTKILKKN